MGKVGLPNLSRLTFQVIPTEPNVPPLYKTFICLPSVLVVATNILDLRIILILNILDMFPMHRVLHQTNVRILETS